MDVDFFSDAMGNPIGVPPWYLEICPFGAGNRGFYRGLGKHNVVFVERDPARLVVTFDNLGEINNTSIDRAPWAYKFLKDQGWSHLGVMSTQDDWFRNPAIISYFEALDDQGFFNSFDDVVFAGSSMGGFGALAFAPYCKESRVVAFNPQSTLDQRVVPWETRYDQAWGKNWDLPRSDVAAGLEKCDRVYIFYDPLMPLDRKHADRFEGPNIVKLKSWFSGHKSSVFMSRIGILKTLMTRALAGELDAAGYYELYRKRREAQWYHNHLAEHARARNHETLLHHARRRGAELADVIEQNSARHEKQLQQKKAMKQAQRRAMKAARKSNEPTSP